MAPIEEIEDPLGFTKETSALLIGLGCTNQSQFKKRNISLEDLKLLTDEDLLVLEVGEDFNMDSFKRLIKSLKRKYEKVKPKFQDVVQMITINQSQLQLLNLYLKYIYAQLALHKEDCFIEKDKNMKVSQALTVACNSILHEVKELEDAIDNMQIISKPKCIMSNSWKKLCIAIGSGVGVLALIYYFKT